MRKAFAVLALTSFVAACPIQTGAYEPARQELNELAEVEASAAAEYKSTDWRHSIYLAFQNNSDEQVQMWWYDYSGNQRPYGKILPYQTGYQWTYASHPWGVKGVNGSKSSFKIDGKEALVPIARDNNRTFVIEKLYKSTEWSNPIELTFVNKTNEPIQIWWHDYSGNLKPYWNLQPGQQGKQWTYATHPWSATCDSGIELTTNGETVFVPEVSDNKSTIKIKRVGDVSEDEDDSAIDGDEEESDTISDPEPAHCDNNNTDPNVTVTGIHGTIFIDNGWIPDDAPTSFQGIGPGESCNHWGYDRRDNKWSKKDFWCFQATYEDDDETVRVQVNAADFTKEEAKEHAELYANSVGKTPKILRLDLNSITINAGNNLFGGGSNDLLVHTDYAENVYLPRKNLEETFMHEGAHVSLDKRLYGTEKWKKAVADDNKFSSNYARDHPQREDVSETYLVWFATVYTPNEFSEEALADWNCYMKHRFEVFAEMSCKPGMMSPWPDC